MGQFEFVEWTSDLHLRHTRFIALREDNRLPTFGERNLAESFHFGGFESAFR